MPTPPQVGNGQQGSGPPVGPLATPTTQSPSDPPGSGTSDDHLKMTTHRDATHMSHGATRTPGQIDATAGARPPTTTTPTSDATDGVADPDQDKKRRWQGGRQNAPTQDTTQGSGGHDPYFNIGEMVHVRQMLQNHITPVEANQFWNAHVKNLRLLERDELIPPSQDYLSKVLRKNWVLWRIWRSATCPLSSSHASTQRRRLVGTGQGLLWVQGSSRRSPRKEGWPPRLITQRR